MAVGPGPFKRTHYYVQWGGTLPGGEIWSCGIRTAPTQPLADLQSATSAGAAGLLDHYATHIKAFHQRSSSMISGRAKLDFVKCNAIGLNGKYVDSNSNTAVFAPINGGGTGSNEYPNQIAIVATLFTSIHRGPGSKGRFYIPLPQTPVDVTTGLITTTAAGYIRDSVIQLLDDMSDTPGLDVLSPDPVVMSRKENAPTCEPIIEVGIGRALDTQRRRRNKLREDYQKGPTDF